jgi:hypothetical protein
VNEENKRIEIAQNFFAKDCIIKFKYVI